MKLICCVACNQVFNLCFDYQECRGGHGGGQYIDRLNAKIWGDLNTIFVLGFANRTLSNALREQIAEGDLPAEYMPGYGVTSPGREFTAFVIPKSAPSIERVTDRFDPIDANILAETRGSSK